MTDDNSDGISDDPTAITTRTNPNAPLFPEEVRSINLTTQAWRLDNVPLFKTTWSDTISSEHMPFNTTVIREKVSKVPDEEADGEEQIDFNDPYKRFKDNYVGKITPKKDVNTDEEGEQPGVAWTENAITYTYPQYKSERSRSFYSEFRVDANFRTAELYAEKESTITVFGDSVSQTHKGTNNAYSAIEHDWSTSIVRNKESRTETQDEKSISLTGSKRTHSEVGVENSTSSVKSSWSDSWVGTSHKHEYSEVSTSYTQKFLTADLAATLYDTSSKFTLIEHANSYKALKGSYSVDLFSTSTAGSLLKSSVSASVLNYTENQDFVTVSYSAGDLITHTNQTSYTKAASKLDWSEKVHIIGNDYNLRLIAQNRKKAADRISTAGTKRILIILYLLRIVRALQGTTSGMPALCVATAHEKHSSLDQAVFDRANGDSGRLAWDGYTSEQPPVDSSDFLASTIAFTAVDALFGVALKGILRSIEAGYRWDDYPSAIKIVESAYKDSHMEGNDTNVGKIAIREDGVLIQHGPAGPNDSLYDEDGMAQDRLAADTISDFEGNARPSIRVKDKEILLACGRNYICVTNVGIIIKGNLFVVGDGNFTGRLSSTSLRAEEVHNHANLDFRKRLTKKPHHIFPQRMPLCFPWNAPRPAE